MDKRIIKVNNCEYEVLITRNIIAAEKAAGEYDYNKITCWHNGLISKLYLRSASYWDKQVRSSTFFYDLEGDLITYIFECPYNPMTVEVIKPIVNVLNDGDRIIVIMKKGNFIERFRIKAKALKEYINTLEGVLVAIDTSMLEKVKSKVGSGAKK